MRDAVCWLLAAAALLAAGSPLRASAAPAAETLALVGAGATADSDFFAAALGAYLPTHPVAISYQSMGAGAGVRQFLANSVDFAASDVPLSADQLRGAVPHGGPVVQVPVVQGGVAIAYHLPQLDSTQQLRLDGPTLAAIFLGRIARWNDRTIAALNPGVSLPAIPVVTVHRSDSSGNTAILTGYLSAISPSWARSVGSGLTVRWPGGIQVYGNSGIASQLLRAPGTIGYVEARYAANNGLLVASLKNRSGAFVVPNAASIEAAAAQFPQVSAAHYLLVDAPGRASYSIASYSWVLLRQRPIRAETGPALVDLFRWLVTSGQQIATDRGYVPLLPAAQHRALVALAGVAGAIAGQVYEAEAASASGGVHIASCVGCSGGHKVRWLGKHGTLTFHVRVASAGSYLLTLAYANAIGDRLVTLRVNDRDRGTFRLPTTGGWDIVGSIAATVPLRAGANTLVFGNPSAYGPDMDAITLTPAA